MVYVCKRRELSLLIIGDNNTKDWQSEGEWEEETKKSGESGEYIGEFSCRIRQPENNKVDRKNQRGGYGGHD